MHSRENRSILVVDDTDAARYATARNLRHSGFKTIEAESGAKALELAEYAAAVVLDIHLPDVIGWEVCRLLRANAATAKIPIVHLSAKFVTPEDREKSIRSGAHLYLMSPVNPQLLAETLDTLIEQAGVGLD